MAQALIDLRGITKVYMRDQDSVPVLNGVDLTVEAGERVAIMGRSGSGKSTLLNILGCLDEPTSGIYRLDGQDVSHLPDGELSRIRNRTFGFVFQAFHLLKGLTIVENVELPMEYGDVPVREQRQRALELLSLVELDHRTSHRPSELSGGERQRVAIARALANHPKVLLADEPTGALDSKAQSLILEVFEKVHRTLGTTQIVVTHDPKVAEDLAKRTIRISDGRIEGESNAA
ncbi:MAG: ABC transporter ATP-binding protein [Myxococcota bacterium]|jgi:putative ABC transport system ATP-binding protein|nr:ABC transporter ATP-binding protein [Myxococcota bacterium]